MSKNSLLVKLFVEHQDRILNYFKWKLNDSELAEDLTQDLFLKISTREEINYDPTKAKFITYIITCAHNMIVDHQRKANKMKLVRDGVLENGQEYTIFDLIEQPVEISIEEKIIERETIDHYRSLFKILSQKELRIVLLRLEGEKFEEISNTTGLHLSTVKARFFRAKDKLQKELIKQKLNK